MDEDNTDNAVQAMLQKLDTSVSELTSRVDQLDPKVTELLHKECDIVSKLPKGAPTDYSKHVASPSNVGLAQNLMAKLQVASTKSVDVSVGVASTRAKKAAAMHTELERDAGVK